MLVEKLRPTGRLSLGKAKPGDAPAIGRILSDWVDETSWMPRVHSRDDEQGFAAELVARGWVTVARRGGAVVGFLARDGEDVVALYVDGPARGAGVGTALIARAKKKSRRLALWTFQINHAARGFYAREGFVETHRTDGAETDEKLPDIHYLWETSR